MKTKLFNFILLGTLLFTGVVSAYTDPSAPYPAGQVTPVVSVGSDQQIKSGAFWAKLLQAGSKVTKTSSLAGFLLAETFNIAPSGFMTHVILPGSDSQFRLGGGVSGALGNTIESGNESLFGYVFGNLNGDVKNILDTNRAPLTIDLLGRGVKETPASRDALAVISGGLCSQPTAIVTTASGVSFKSDYNKVLTDSNLKSDYADVLARQLRLKGGNPGKDKVLVAVDSLGNATWGTLKFEPVTKPNRPLYTAGCVLDPEYPKPGQQLCANTQNGQCATCSNATISECGKGIGYGHCKWDPQAIEIPGEGSVTTGMNVTVVYDKADSPVRASQMMCGLKDPVEPILGCTDKTAFNYNPKATKDNNSCIPKILGCMTKTAENYNADANVDDGSCKFAAKDWKMFTTTPKTTTIVSNGTPGQSCLSWIQATGRNYSNDQYRVLSVDDSYNFGFVDWSKTKMTVSQPLQFTQMNDKSSCLYSIPDNGSITGKRCSVISIGVKPPTNATPTSNCTYTTGGGFGSGSQELSSRAWQFQVYE